MLRKINAAHGAKHVADYNAKGKKDIEKPEKA
jgi:hypothetical protein